MPNNLKICIHESVTDVASATAEALDTMVVPRLSASVQDKETNDGLWLHLDFDGTTDNRITSTTDSTHYSVDDYDWEPGEPQKIPCRIYRLSVNPAIFDDDANIVSDDMPSLSYDVSVEFDPDGSTATLDILKSESDSGTESTLITRDLVFPFTNKPDSDISDMVDYIVARIRADLSGYGYVG